MNGFYSPFNKTWYGSFVVKDVYQGKQFKDWWLFMENDELTHNFNPINQFHNMDGIDIYYVNTSDSNIWKI